MVLAGDAAHSVCPALGQGANAALEGAAVLAGALRGVRRVVGGVGVESGGAPGLRGGAWGVAGCAQQPRRLQGAQRLLPQSAALACRLQAHAGRHDPPPPRPPPGWLIAAGVSTQPSSPTTHHYHQHNHSCPPSPPQFAAPPADVGGAGDVEGAAAEYSRRWLPNALAVVELMEEGFGGNRRAFTLNLKLVQVRPHVCVLFWGGDWGGPGGTRGSRSGWFGVVPPSPSALRLLGPPHPIPLRCN